MYTVVFDLDGTISDPAEGITQSINHALLEMGYSAYPEVELLDYIGPHLDVTFRKLAGITSDEELSKAIELYRERYLLLGYRENFIYEGIMECLSNLLSEGALLCIATSKRQDIAVQVLKFLEIDRYFHRVFWL